MKNSTGKNYSPKQGRLPVFLAESLEICDPVLDLGIVLSDPYAHKCCKIAGVKSVSKHYKYKKPGDPFKTFSNLLLAGVNINGSDVFESLTVGTSAQHFFQVLSRGGGPLVQAFIRAVRQIFFNVQFYDFCVQFLLTSAIAQLGALPIKNAPPC